MMGPIKLAHASVEQIAIVIGVDRPDAGQVALQPLTYPSRDARLMAETLSSFPDFDAIYLFEQETQGAVDGDLIQPRGPSTWANLRAEIEALTAGERANSSFELLVYFSGHGRNGQLFFADQAVEASTFWALFDHPNIREMAVILDSCYGRSLINDKGDGGFEIDFDALFAKPFPKPEVERAGHGTVKAITAAGPTFEMGALHSGLISHATRSCLSGVADASGDQIVTFSELGQCIQDYVAKLWQRNQIQIEVVDKPTVGFPQWHLNRQKAHIQLPKSAPNGRYLVLDDAHRIVAEVFKTASTQIHLPKGHYQLFFIRETGRLGQRVHWARRWDLELGDKSWQLDSEQLAPWVELRSAPIQKSETDAPAAVSTISLDLADYLFYHRSRPKPLALTLLASAVLAPTLRIAEPQFAGEDGALAYGSTGAHFALGLARQSPWQSLFWGGEVGFSSLRIAMGSQLADESLQTLYLGPTLTHFAQKGRVFIEGGPTYARTRLLPPEDENDLESILYPHQVGARLRGGLHFEVQKALALQWSVGGYYLEALGQSPLGVQWGLCMGLGMRVQS